jgi:hypothetical protein
MPSHTKFLSRLIGLYLVLISLAMLTHKQSTIESMTALMHNPPLVFVTAVFAMAAGLAMVLGHNVWSGGVLPVVVTLTGWAMLIKAALLLFLPPAAANSFFLAGLHYEQHFYQYMSFSLLFGVCLTCAGFRSTPR